MCICLQLCLCRYLANHIDTDSDAATATCVHVHTRVLETPATRELGLVFALVSESVSLLRNSCQCNIFGGCHICTRAHTEPNDLRFVAGDRI